jgi:hypothetical protein
VARLKNMWFKLVLRFQRFSRMKIPPQNDAKLPQDNRASALYSVAFAKYLLDSKILFSDTPKTKAGRNCKSFKNDSIQHHHHHHH